RYKSEGPLSSIPGTVPNLSRPPSGCRFHPRCPLARDACKASSPPLAIVGAESKVEIVASHRSACFFPEEVPNLP
ncbi:MAG: hypothetical protein L3K05_08225, partial [Thermoplasmata archaeon]|nr:hypothetical protein [Thermoplasmata archaeon]